MTPPGRDPGTRAHAALARDAALARVVHARRWVILGSAGLSAGFAALVSTSPPSKASTTSAKQTPAPPAATTTTRPSAGQAPALPPLPDGTALGLQGPGQAPQGDDSQSAQSAPSQQAQSAPAQSAPAQQPAPSPQPGPVSGGS